MQISEERNGELEFVEGGQVLRAKDKDGQANFAGRCIVLTKKLDIEVKGLLSRSQGDSLSPKAKLHYHGILIPWHKSLAGYRVIAQRST